MTTTVSAEELLEWFQDPANRCYFNRDLLSIKKSPISSGVGVFSKKTQSPVPADMDEDDANVLLRVHKSMVLSSQTSTISNLLYDHKLSGMYGLVLSFIYEKQLGEKSPWFVYLNTINYKDDKGEYILPLCLCSEKDKNILKGTEIEFMGGLESDELIEHFQISCDFAKEVNEDVGLRIPDCLNGDMNSEGFKEFAAITMAVASRAFEIDNYIELALVPGADLFNHDCHGEENVHFVTLGDVCHYCGKADGCWHEDFGPPDSESEEEEEEEEDQRLEEIDSELEKDISGEFERTENDEIESISDIEEEEQLEEITMDYIEKMEKELAEEKEREKEEEEDSDDEIGENDNDIDYSEFFMNADECCDIVLERKVVKNKEVFNTYGELSNAILLVKYGFAVEDNIYDSICLGPQIVAYKKEHPELEERFDWWSCMGWILLREEEKEIDSDDDGDDDDDEKDYNDDEDDDDDDDSWLYQCRVVHPGKANSQLLAVSRLLTMTTEDFEKMIGDEECDGEMIVKKLVKSKASKESKNLLKKWVKERYSVTGDGKTRSGDLKRNLKKSSSNNGRRTMFTVALMNEKKLLESALK